MTSRLDQTQQTAKPISGNRTVWIDLDNSPHVPFFIPIIRELERRGYEVVLTARDTFQVVGLLHRYNLKCDVIGAHYGANKFLKVIGTIWRTVQLASVVSKHSPHVSISHGSRSLVLLSALLGIPTILMFDYEHVVLLPLVKPVVGIAPEVIQDARLAASFMKGLRVYSGIKEDVYVPSFQPDPVILRQLDLTERSILVTVRPPASEAHYHNPESDQLFVSAVEFLGQYVDVRMVILPRNEKTQKDFVLSKWPAWCQERKIIIPERVVDGLNLIWHSDLVISGGGTMNREAAALGVPVYSIFRGKIGAVDQYLQQKGRLVLIESPQDVARKIIVSKRPKIWKGHIGDNQVLSQIMTIIEDVIVG